MTTATERALRRWRAVLLLLALLLGLAAIAILLGVVAVRVATAPGAFVLWALVLLAVVLAAARLLGFLATRVPRRTVLTLDLASPLADLPPDDPRGRLSRRDRPGLRDVVETLDRAAGDERVAGLWCRIGRPAGGLADVQELRDAVAGFRGRGKFALVFSESFGDGGSGTAGYYLATAFDEVVLQPSGDLVLSGLAREMTFAREALDRLRVTTQFDARREYKSAANVLTERHFTPPQREELGRIVEVMFGQVVGGVAGGRSLDEAAVRGLVDRAPLLAGEAVEGGLVDRLGYRDESVARARERAGEGARLVPLADYRRRTRRRQGTDHGRLLSQGEAAGAAVATRSGGQPAPAAGGAGSSSGRRRRRSRPPTVALVHGTGVVTSGRSRFNPLTARSMGADSITAAIREAVADAKVAAILFRVDSPGGSYTGSDAIWRELGRAREAGKPVVASMGNVAGSGGYFVALPADRIVAHPASITGSVGVVSGKAVLGGLRERLGLTRDEVHAGAHALMWSTQQPFSPSEWDRFQAWLDRCYADFTAKVARARGFGEDEVEEVARGRVWAGADALDRRMIDALGGYPRAFAEVRALLGLPAGDELRVVAFPRRPSPLARLTGRDRKPDDEGIATGLHAADLLPSPSRLAADLGLSGQDAALLMPEPWSLTSPRP